MAFTGSTWWPGMRKAPARDPAEGDGRASPPQAPGAVHSPSPWYSSFIVYTARLCRIWQQPREAERLQTHSTHPSRCEPWGRGQPRGLLCNLEGLPVRHLVFSSTWCHSRAVACLLLSERELTQPGEGDQNQVPGHSHEDAPQPQRGLPRTRPASTLEDAPSPSGFLLQQQVTFKPVSSVP